jgi:hypothetical protein
MPDCWSSFKTTRLLVSVQKLTGVKYVHGSMFKSNIVGSNIDELEVGP